MDQKTLDLAKEYPDLFVDIDKPSRESCMAFGCACDDGWWDLLDEACAQLSGTGIKFLQVKEKLGALVIYVDKHAPETDNIIKQIYLKSKTVCEICGKTGQMSTNKRRLKTLCEEHRQELEYEVYIC